MDTFYHTKRVQIWESENSTQTNQKRAKIFNFYRDAIKGDFVDNGLLDVSSNSPWMQNVFRIGGRGEFPSGEPSEYGAAN